MPVLIPLNTLGGNNATYGVDGLDRLSWTNVNSNYANFYWAHLLIIFFVIEYVCLIIYKKLLFYMEIRNCFLALSEQERLESATTILVTDIPDNDLSTLREIYSIFPGEVRSIKINRDISALSKKILRRQKLICAYKTAVIKSMKSAIYSQQRTENYASSRSWKSPIPSLSVKHNVKNQYLQELEKLNKDVRKDQHKLIELYYTGETSKEFPKIKSAFVRFNAQLSA